MSRELAVTISVYTSNDNDSIHIFREWPNGDVEGGVADEATAAQIKLLLEARNEI